MTNRYRTSERSHRAAFATMLLLICAWFAAPHAGQDGANDGFILFTSDRANPQRPWDVHQCEDIYVMRRTARTRPASHMVAVPPTIRAPTTAAAPTGPTARS